MPRIPEETIQEILRANPIEDVVGQYLVLRPDGRNLKALCPFHKEKTPSFKVHPAKGIFRCYGCGQSGNAISFVMAQDRVDFLAAVRSLAERAGIALRTEGGPSSDVAEQARKANELACEFYRRQLAAGGGFGAAARTYLVERGIDEEAQKLFRLGAAPDAWDELLAYLRREGIRTEAMEESGLVRRRKQGDGYYDYFRGRIMFPIMDVRGRVVGFGGRALGDEEPKYLNTPETPFFRKGRLLYGLHLAGDACRAGRPAVLVEGYTDVIMAVTHGIEGVVACLGTALTRDNARELKRYTDEVVLLYDGDEAGLRAQERALGPILSHGIEVRVSPLPEGLDPCDFIRERGAGALVEQIEEARDAVSFLVDRASAAEGTDTPARLRRAVARCLAPLGDVEDPLMRELVRKKVAEAFGVNEAALERAAPKARRSFEGREDGAERSRVRSYPGPEEMLVTALVADPAVALEAEPPASFEDPVLGEIAREVYRRAGAGVSPLALQAALAGTSAGERVVELLGRIEEFARLGELLDWQVVARNSREELARRRARKEGEAVREELEAARGRGDKEEVRRLLARYQALIRHAKGGSGEKRAQESPSPQEAL
jgi:DNA primase